jgi:hypothetical protein
LRGVSPTDMLLADCRCALSTSAIPYEGPRQSVGPLRLNPLTCRQGSFPSVVGKLVTLYTDLEVLGEDSTFLAVTRKRLWIGHFLRTDGPLRASMSTPGAQFGFKGTTTLAEMADRALLTSSGCMVLPQLTLHRPFPHTGLLRGLSQLCHWHSYTQPGHSLLSLLPPEDEQAFGERGDDEGLA